MALSFSPPRPPRSSWRALRVYRHDADLSSHVSSVYGYRGECSCGWLGPVRRTVSLVRLTILEHRAEAHP